MQMYDLGPEGRAALGARAREHAHRDYDIDKMIGAWDQTLTKLTDTWHRGKDRWKAVEI